MDLKEIIGYIEMVLLAAVYSAIILGVIILIEKFIIHLVRMIKAIIRKNDKKAEDNVNEEVKKTKKLSTFAVFNSVLYMIIFGCVLAIGAYIYAAPMAN